jgi:NitT/TauT family transport system permease protein
VATAAASVAPTAVVSARASSRRRLRPVIGFLAIVAVLIVAWEAAKWLAGDPWRYASFLGTGIAIDHRPPFRIVQFNDINLPHVWDIVAVFFSLDARGQSLFEVLIGAGLFTLRNAALGFAIGAIVGLGLAIVIVHIRLVERALVPLLVVSQTIPIIAIAPLIVIGLRADWLGVAVVTSYLTFFPVTIAAIRGMRSYDPRAYELLTSYAAGRRTILWKLRLPASTAYLFTAFKVAATASIVGAIVGELPSGITQGLARQILTGLQYYTLNPAKLWAAIVVASAFGMAAFFLVVIVERRVLRGTRPAETGADA